METEKSLYQKCGGYDSIATVVDELFSCMKGDALFDSFTIGHSTDSMRRRRQLVVDFICEEFGGPVLYNGRDLATAHDGLDITEDQWDAMSNYLSDILDSCGASQDVKDEIFNSMLAVSDYIVQDRIE